MSLERIKIAPEMFDIMPPEYQDLVQKATYGNESRGWKDIGTSKELIEEHSLCAGCPESMAFRYILASLPNPEDTVMVGSTGCTSLVFPMWGFTISIRCLEIRMLLHQGSSVPSPFDFLGGSKMWSCWPGMGPQWILGWI